MMRTPHAPFLICVSIAVELLSGARYSQRGHGQLHTPELYARRTALFSRSTSFHVMYVFEIIVSSEFAGWSYGPTGYAGKGNRVLDVSQGVRVLSSIGGSNEGTTIDVVCIYSPALSTPSGARILIAFRLPPYPMGL